jgi:hypothetical protein
MLNALWLECDEELEGQNAVLYISLRHAKVNIARAGQRQNYAGPRQIHVSLVGSRINTLCYAPAP